MNGKLGMWTLGALLTITMGLSAALWKMQNDTLNKLDGSLTALTSAVQSLSTVTVESKVRLEYFEKRLDGCCDAHVERETGIGG